MSLSTARPLGGLTPVPVTRQTRSLGVRLTYDLWGTREEPVIVLLHGLTEQRHGWDPIPAILADYCRVITVDLRGHGDSEWAGHGYPIDAFVADLRAVLTDAGVDECVLVGHSMGGHVALAFAARYPETARALFLVDSAPAFSTKMNLFVRELLSSRPIGFGSPRAVEDFYQKTFPGWHPALYRGYARHQTRLNWAGKLDVKWDPSLFWLSGSFGAREVPQLWDLAATIRCPAALAVGVRESGGLEDELVARLVSLIPHLDVVEYDGGHHLFRDLPAQFLRQLMQFAGFDTDETDHALSRLEDVLAGQRHLT